MGRGLFFEQQCLGASAGEYEEIPTLPRLSNGRKSVDQIRIEAQVVNFKRLLKRYHCEAEKVQHEISRVWMHNYADMFDEEIILFGTTDFEGPIYIRAFNKNNEIVELDFDDAVHDLKLTKSIHATLPDGSTWKYPWTIKDLQARMYKYISGKPFFYWIFDYKPNYEHRIYYVDDDPQKELEMHEAIRKTAEKLMEFKELGYPERPFFNICQHCPIKDCESRKNKIECQIM